MSRIAFWGSDSMDLSPLRLNLCQDSDPNMINWVPVHFVEAISENVSRVWENEKRKGRQLVKMYHEVNSHSGQLVMNHPWELKSQSSGS